MNVGFALFPGCEDGVAGASTDSVKLDGLRSRCVVGGYGLGGKCVNLVVVFVFGEEAQSVGRSNFRLKGGFG